MAHIKYVGLIFGNAHWFSTNGIFSCNDRVTAIRIILSPGKSLATDGIGRMEAAPVKLNRGTYLYTFLLKISNSPTISLISLICSEGKFLSFAQSYLYISIAQSFRSGGFEERGWIARSAKMLSRRAGVGAHQPPIRGLDSTPPHHASTLGRWTIVRAGAHLSFSFLISPNVSLSTLTLCVILKLMLVFYVKQ